MGLGGLEHNRRAERGAGLRLATPMVNQVYMAAGIHDRDGGITILDGKYGMPRVPHDDVNLVAHGFHLQAKRRFPRATRRNRHG